MNQELSIFDPSVRKYVDVFCLALMETSYSSLIPELYRIFGKDKMIELLDTFVGTTITFPGREEIEEAVRDTTIYVRLNRNSHPSEVEELSKEFKIHIDTVVKIFSKMRGLVDAVEKVGRG